MADRHQNINISYNVRSDDLGKVEQQARRAEEATRKLEQSAVSVGQKGSSSNRAYIRSIESIKVEMQRTRQLIDLTNRADTKLLNQRITKYRQLKKELQDFNRHVEGSGKAATRASTSFFNLNNIIGTVFSVHVIRRIGQMALDMARLQGNTEGVGRAFRRAIPNADAMMQRLREATHGTVTDLELMQRTLRAANLGIPIEQFGTLLEFATIRAQQTGESVDYLIDSIVTGLGRKSTRVIDNLGISALRVKEALGGLSLEAASVGQVTEAVIKIANEEMEKMGGFVANAATQVGQLEVAWNSLMTEIAESAPFEEGLSLIREYLDSFQLLIEAQNRGVSVDEVLADRRRKHLALLEAETFLQRKLTGDREKDIAFLEELIHTTQKDVLVRNNLIAKQNQLIAGMEEERDKIKATNIAYQQNTAEMTRDIAFKRTVVKELINEKLHVEEWLSIYLQKLNALKKVNDETVTQIGLIQEVQRDIADYTKLINESRNEEAIARWNQQIFILQGRLHDLQNLGLPEFKSPEVLERVGKVIDEKIKKGFEESNKELQDMEAVLNRLSGRIVPIEVKVDEIQFMDSWDKILTSIEENWRDLTMMGIGIFSDFLIGSREAELESYQQRLDALSDFYDEQITLAGDNERAKAQLELQEKKRTDALRKEQARKEKDARRYQIIVDTAAALARVWIQPGFPLAVALTPLIIANAAQQLSVLNKAQPRGFFKGEIGIDGPGTSTSDSIPAKLSKGESVINAEATRKSRGLLEAINARKLDDRVLQELHLSRPSVNVSGMDPGPIVEAIRAQKQTDVMSIGRTLFVAHNATATHKRYVRTKIMGKFSR